MPSGAPLEKRNPGRELTVAAEFDAAGPDSRSLGPKTCTKQASNDTGLIGEVTEGMTSQTLLKRPQNRVCPPANA